MDEPDNPYQFRALRPGEAPPGYEMVYPPSAQEASRRMIEKLEAEIAADPNLARIVRQVEAEVYSRIGRRRP